MAKKATRQESRQEDDRRQGARPRRTTSAPRAPTSWRTQLSNLKKEQFNLRFQRANGQVENTGRIRILRRDIARIQTVLTEQRRAAQAKG